MNETAPTADVRPQAGQTVIIGVDTHKLTHAAAAISMLGARLGTMTIPANGKGYQALEAWAQSLGSIRAFGVEGTGSYGTGLSRFLCEHGHAVLEVNRPNRQLRYQKGKNDPGATQGWSHRARRRERRPRGAERASDRRAEGRHKLGRDDPHLKIARDTAVKGCTQAMQTLKAIIVISPVA